MKFNKLGILSLGSITPFLALPLCNFCLEKTNNYSSERYLNQEDAWNWFQTFNTQNSQVRLLSTNNYYLDAWISSVTFNFIAPRTYYNQSNFANRSLNNVSCNLININGGAIGENGNKKASFSLPTDRPSMNWSYTPFGSLYPVDCEYHTRSDITNIPTTNNFLFSYDEQSNLMLANLNGNMQLGFHFKVDDTSSNNYDENLNFGSLTPYSVQYNNSPSYFLNKTSFNEDQLLIPDYDKSFYDATQSYLVLKLNEDYLAADLLSWDTIKNEVSGQKDPITGDFDNSHWIQQPDIAQFAKMLPQWALNDLSNAIIDGRLIDCDVDSGIFDWTIPTTSIKPLEWYDNTEQSWSLSNFLMNHAHDDQQTMEQAINDLPILKWKIDYIAQHIDITSALQFDDYLDVVTNLLTQNLNYTLLYTDGADQSIPKTKTFNLNDILGAEITLSFNYPTIDNIWFQLQSCITNDGSFGNIGTSDTLGIYDIANDKVWSLNGDSSNYWSYNPNAFTLSNALDEIDGNPLDQNAGFFYGPTELDDNPTAWDAFTKILYAKTPSQIKSYIDVGEVPASDTQGLGDIPFDKTCFVKVKDAFETSYTIDQVIDSIDYAINDNTGTLQLTVHFKDEASGDQPQILNVQLFAKNVILQKHNRSTPVKIEPSQINQQYILDNLVAYNGIAVGDDDSYLFETNLSKTEFAQALKGVVFKVQDDDNGKLDVIFNIYSNVYNMNPSGMPVPDLQSIEITDNDFTPLHPKHGTNLTALWAVLGIVGSVGILIFIIKFAKRGKKYNSAYDDENVDDELNKRKLDAKQAGKEFVSNDESKEKRSSDSKETQIIKTSDQDDEEALKG